jgi:hypothetical protein
VIAEFARDPALQLALHAAAALLFVAAAAHKLRDLPGFRGALAGYRLLPEPLVPAAAAGLVTAELAVALGCLVPGAGGAAALAGCGLLALYSAAAAVNLVRGRRSIDCGCGGPAGRRPLSGGLLGRNAALVALLLVCALPAGGRPLVWLDALTIVSLLALLALLYAALDVAVANAARLRETGGPAWATP